MTAQAQPTTAVRAWQAFGRLTELGWPKRFPVVQFPNLPLIVAFAAGLAHRFTDGRTATYLAAVGYLAMTIWAYEELANGSNWFRRLLGATFLVLLVLRVAHAITTG